MEGVPSTISTCSWVAPSGTCSSAPSGSDVAALIDLGEGVAAAAERKRRRREQATASSSTAGAAMHGSVGRIDTVISLASRASAGLPEVPRNSNEQLNAAVARPANPMISLPFRRPRPNPNIDALYGMIVAQARSPAFYLGYGVPDTVAGRLDMIVLHLVLVLRRLTLEVAAPAVGQKLFDRFSGHRRQLPRNGRRRPDRAQGDAARRGAFYGRAKAYESALADDDAGRSKQQSAATSSALPSRRWARGGVPICGGESPARRARAGRAGAGRT